MSVTEFRYTVMLALQTRGAAQRAGKGKISSASLTNLSTLRVERFSNGVHVELSAIAKDVQEHLLRAAIRWDPRSLLNLRSLFQGLKAHGLQKRRGV
jgi:hypothetical protein